MVTTQLDSFVVWDVETTSKWSSHARVVEYAVASFERFLISPLGCTVSARTCPDNIRHHAVANEWRHCSTYSSRVDPNESIPKEASAIHGIYDHDVVSAPSTKQALPHLLDALHGQVVVGYNILQYDFDVLHNECRRHGLDAAWRDCINSLCGIVDVMPWAARTTQAPLYRKGARTLSTMSKRHGVVLESAHAAADDAVACGWLMLSLMSSGAMPAGLGDVVEATWSTWQHLRG